MKLFLDTNVWLSGLLFSGVCETLLLETADREVLLSSELMRDEAHAVLKRKFSQVGDACARFDLIWREAIVVPDFPEPADDNDRRLVRAAAQANAAIFVTGDARILEWKSEGEMRILSPRDAYIDVFAPHLKK